MSDCLHCDINDLVGKRLERDGADLAEVAALIAESLANLGHAYLEKSSEIEAGETSRH
jgi:hypothetical protein